MITPDYSFWLRFFGVLFAETCFVCGAAYIAQRWSRSVLWKKACWQIALFSLLIIVVAEGSGFGRAAFASLVATTRETLHVEPSSESDFQPLSTSELTAAQSGARPAELARVTRATAVWWPGILFSVGASLVLARMVFARALLLVLRLRGASKAEGGCSSLATSVAGRLGIKKTISLMQMSGLHSPIAFGILWPGIGLPRDFETRFNAPAQEAMLAHELAHLAARDPLWYLLADLTVVLLWWHPLAWKARARLHAASEMAADEASAVLKDGPGVLAECLLQVARRSMEFGRLKFVGIGGSGGNLSERVHRLLDDEIPRYQRPRTRTVVARAISVLLLTAGVVVGSGWLQRDSFAAENGFQGALRESWNSSASGFVVAALGGVADDQLSASTAEKTGAISSEALKRKLDTTKRVQAGKALYESGELEKAEKLLKEALRLDPQNQAAAYYLDLIRQSKLHQVTRPSLTPLTNHSKATSPAKGLFSKTFRVGSDYLLRALKNENLESALPVSQQAQIAFHENLRLFFTRKGARLEPPATFLFNDRKGLLYVRATLEDLEAVDRVLSPPSLTLETSCFRLTPEIAKALGFGWLSDAHPEAPAVPGVLTDLQYRVLLRDIEQQERNPKRYRYPKVTTISGRQAHITIQSRQDQPPGVDILPTVQQDGVTIELTVATAQPGKVAVLASEKPADCVRVWDGQTAMCRAKNSDWIVFVTATLIDAAGNRLHQEEDLPFVKDSTPPQAH